MIATEAIQNAIRDFLDEYDEQEAEERLHCADVSDAFRVDTEEQSDAPSSAARWIAWLSDLSEPDTSARMIVSATGPTRAAALHELNRAVEERRWWGCWDRRRAALNTVEEAIQENARG